MEIPLQISFRNMDPSPAVEERIRKKAAKLERFHDRIIGCTIRASSIACGSISAYRVRTW